MTSEGREKKEWFRLIEKGFAMLDRHLREIDKRLARIENIALNERQKMSKGDENDGDGLEVLEEKERT